MSLVVNTNTASINAQNYLNMSTNDLSHTFAELSSGLRITDAADDPAGLGVSERMKAQIASLQQASRNTQDGTDLVQTADGALSQTQSILSTMRALAVQASNGSLSSGDLANVQTQFGQLQKEVTQIAGATAFNGVQLLDGSTSSLTFQTGSDQSGSLNGVAINQITVNLQDMSANGLNIGSTPDQWAGDVSQASAATALGTAGTLTLGTGGPTVSYTAASTLSSVAQQISGIAGWSASVGTNANGTSALVIQGPQTTVGGAAAITDSGKMIFGSGASVAADYTAGAGSVDVSTQANALSSITALDTAINTVSTFRATLGSVVDRFQSSTAATASQVQNLTTAQSDIADVDVAQATAQMSRDQVLEQAGVAVLAQANQSPQLALKLLGG
jgi:flagellin